MHRRIERDDDVDVAYTTLVNTLKKVGIHDPQRDRQATKPVDDDESADDDEPADEPVVGTDEPPIEDDGDSDAGDDQQASKNETSDTDSQDDARGDRDGDTDSAASGETEGSDDQRQAVVTVDEPEAAETVADLATPEWLTEASFHVALEMSETAAEFADNLGWGDPEELRVMAEVIGEGDRLGGEDDA